jgi:hypothetical protein
MLANYFKRLARVAFAMLVLCSIGLQAQMPADSVLVVVPARGSTIESAAVEDTVKALKAARKQLEIEAHQLPILRLNHRQNKPALVLQSLGLKPTGAAQILLCRRGTSGWPEELLEQCSPGENLLFFVRRASRGPAAKKLPPRQPDPQIPAREEPPELASAGRVGVLLVYRGEDKKIVQPFLAELGRHWMERYGRVRPSPYPLASYDLSKAGVADGVAKAFPTLLVNENPKVALCFFLKGRPVKVLEVYEEVTLPATLVRQISAARRRHLADSISTGDKMSAPDTNTLELSDGQEKTVLLSRVHELAQQLWRQTLDPKPENKLAHRALIQIVELTRYNESQTRVWSEPLAEALADFQSEPLLLEEGSNLEPVQNQLLEIIERLVPDE